MLLSATYTGYALKTVYSCALGHFRKDPYSIHGGNLCRPEGWEKNLFLMIVSVLEHLKGVGGGGGVTL